MKENGLDVGFAFDGDADRCLAVDENGKAVSGDEIMYMCARHMAERGRLDNNTLVTTVMSNFGLYKALDELGIKYEKTAVGDKYVWENMRANGHLIGGEQSGHIIFSKYATTGDGLITAIKVMQVMLDTKLPLSKLAAPVTIYPQVLKNVIVDDKDGTMADEGRSWRASRRSNPGSAGRDACCCARAARSPCCASWPRPRRTRAARPLWTR